MPAVSGSLGNAMSEREYCQYTTDLYRIMRRELRRLRHARLARAKRRALRKAVA